MEITIDVTDWLDETQRTEEQAITLDDFIRLAVENGIPTAQIGRMHIVQRELGLVEDDDVLLDNKSLLQSGARQAINWAFKRRKTEIEVNGKTYGVRELVGGIADDDNGNSNNVSEDQTSDATFGSTASYIPGENHDEGATLESAASTKQEPAATWHVLGTPGALEDAVKYLDRRLPGEIVGRCLIIKASGGDVQESLAKLFDKIVKIAADFAEESA